MKLINLINARRIITKYKDEKVSTVLAYRLLKFMKASDTEETLFNEKFREIINQYGQRNNDGELIFSDGNVSLIPDKINECKTQLKELENIEVDAPTVRFSIAELGELKMSIADLFVLDEIIEEEQCH